MPGTLLDLGPLDHRGGIEQLTLRVTQIGAEYDRVPTIEWLSLKGVVVRSDGTPGTETATWVRTAALAEAIRPVGWLPGPPRPTPVPRLLPSRPRQVPDTRKQAS